jgi:hypothetical protein
LKENQVEESPKRTGAAMAQPLPYQQRALAEHGQLNDRQVLLGEFLKSSQFTSLVPTEQVHLYKQFNLQKQLLEVLALRIASFS